MIEHEQLFSFRLEPKANRAKLIRKLIWPMRKCKTWNRRFMNTEKNN